MTGNNERLRCLTLINNRKSIFQQLAVNGNLSSFHELTMHSSARTRPTATANYRLVGGFTNRALSRLASPLSFLLWQFFLTRLSSLILLQVFWFCLVKEKLLSPTLTSSHFKYIYIYFLHWSALSCQCLSQYLQTLPLQEAVSWCAGPLRNDH